MEHHAPNFWASRSRFRRRSSNKFSHLKNGVFFPTSTSARNPSRRGLKNRRGPDQMAYSDELLELAQDIANLHAQRPHQPSLRRAVSTAYYALFHLLISEATSNWGRPELRAILAQVFDHGPTKQAAEPPTGR